MKPIAVGDRDGVRSPGIRPQLVVVSAIGRGQILAWGSSYYLAAVLAKPIADNTGWPLLLVVGALSLGVIVAPNRHYQIRRRGMAHRKRSLLSATRIGYERLSRWPANA